jgi:hypothetical protein
MPMPDDLRKKFKAFEAALPDAWSNIALVAEFRRLFEDTELTFSAPAPCKMRPLSNPDFIAVDETTRWPPEDGSI